MQYKQVRITAYGRCNDTIGDLTPPRQTIATLERMGIPYTTLIIDPLSAGWHTPVAPDHFRSGASPIFALEYASTMIEQGKALAVIISGIDPLRSGYSREQRSQLMNIYPECSLPEGYTKLASAYCARKNWSSAQFNQLANALFKNYEMTALTTANYKPPNPDRFEYVTSLFRGVDCANPVVDFEGQLVLAHADLMPEFGVCSSMKVRSTSTAALPKDGPQAIANIAEFSHLVKSFNDAVEVLPQPFNSLFKSGDALLDLYTCFPVIPLAALAETGMAESFNQILTLLEQYPVTVTGGMNLARGAWNNPALNGIIAMCETLKTEEKPYGLVHANGGLGYKQGWCVIENTQAQ